MTPTTSLQALTSIVLRWGGGLFALLGFLFALSGVYSIASGEWFGQAGGASLLIWGAVFAPAGLLAAWKGQKIYSEIKKENDIAG